MSLVFAFQASTRIRILSQNVGKFKKYRFVDNLIFCVQAWLASSISQTRLGTSSSLQTALVASALISFSGPVDATEPTYRPADESIIISEFTDQLMRISNFAAQSILDDRSSRGVANFEQFGTVPCGGSHTFYFESIYQYGQSSRSRSFPTAGRNTTETDMYACAVDRDTTIDGFLSRYTSWEDSSPRGIQGIVVDEFVAQDLVITKWVNGDPVSFTLEGYLRRETDNTARHTEFEYDISIFKPFGPPTHYKSN
jgi:hypothetical protein